MSSFRSAVAACTAVVAAWQFANAGATGTETGLQLQQYLQWQDVADARFSPDGRQLAYTRLSVDAMTDQWVSAVWISARDGASPRRIAAGSGAKWSPDGKQLLYRANDSEGRPQLFVWPVGPTGSPRQITTSSELPTDFHWSPDGTQIVFRSFVPAQDEGMPLPIEFKPAGARWTAEPVIEDRLHYRLDTVGYLRRGYWHLFLVPEQGGAPRQLTHGKWSVEAPTDGPVDGRQISWAPDGRSIVYVRLQEPDGMFEFSQSQLERVDITTGATQRIVDRPGTWRYPRISPDSKRVVFTGAPMSERIFGIGELWTAALDGSGMQRIAGSLSSTPMDLHWSPDGKLVYFTMEHEGDVHVYAVALAGGEPRQVTTGTEVISLDSLAGGRAAGVRSTPQEPRDVVTFSLPQFKSYRRLTAVNREALASVRLGAVEELRFKSRDGTGLQGWLVKPPQFDAKRKYPLMLQIHGGPHIMYDTSFKFDFQHYASSGYAVLYTNPRGSTGYGSEFANAIADAYPGQRDLDDLLGALDAGMREPWIDAARVCATGYSGGGVLTLWLLSHSDVLAAGVARSPVSDWLSMAGTSDITAWVVRQFPDRPWRNAAAWLAHSPLMHAEAIRAPLLLMTGEKDLRTPMSQTEEIYTALRTASRPVRMVRVVGEWHGTTAIPSNFVRTQLYTLDWCGRWRRDAPAQ